MTWSKELFFAGHSGFLHHLQLASQAISYHCSDSNPGPACEKVANDLELGGGFCWALWFPPPLTNGQSRLTRHMAENLAKFQNASAGNVLSNSALT